MEAELKLNLKSKENFRKLAFFLKCAGKFSLQKNYFFDTKDRLLRQHKLALRIREDNNCFYLTAKGPRKESDTLHIREEHECLIQELEAKSIISNTSNISGLNYEPLSWLESELNKKLKELNFIVFVSFSNKRYKRYYVINGKKLFFELDETEFANGSRSYELEIEFNDEEEYKSYQESIKNIFKELNIEWTISTVSKLEQAINLI